MLHFSTMVPYGVLQILGILLEGTNKGRTTFSVLGGSSAVEIWIQCVRTLPMKMSQRKYAICNRLWYASKSNHNVYV